jgi:hypothetical protein
MGLVLAIARAVNYRPGSVSPVVAVMFVTPIALFYTSVGADELAYRVIEAEYGPRSSRFEPVRDATQQISDLLHGVERPTFERLVSQVMAGELDPLKRRVRDYFLLRLLSDRSEAYEACKIFLADYPKSRYVPNVLFIQARVLDTRLDERKLLQSTPVRELYFDYPHTQSEPVWTALYSDYPASPLRVAAGVRLAQLYLRRGEVTRSLDVLRTVLGETENAAATVATQPAARFLGAATLDPGFDYDVASYRREAAFLREMIAENCDDPKHGNEPLVTMARLDPHRPLFPEQLADLVQSAAGGRLHDNLLAAQADLIADIHQRARHMESLLEQLPEGGDGRAQIMLRLADLDLRADEADSRARRERGVLLLNQLVAGYAETSWARLARERLNSALPGEPEPTVRP